MPISSELIWRFGPEMLLRRVALVGDKESASPSIIAAYRFGIKPSEAIATSVLIRPVH